MVGDTSQRPSAGTMATRLVALAGRAGDMAQVPAEATGEREVVCWGHSVPKFGVNRAEVTEALQVVVARGNLLVPAVSLATLQGFPAAQPLLLPPSVALQPCTPVCAALPGCDPINGSAVLYSEKFLCLNP